MERASAATETGWSPKVVHLVWSKALTCSQLIFWTLLIWTMPAGLQLVPLLSALWQLLIAFVKRCQKSVKAVEAVSWHSISESDVKYIRSQVHARGELHMDRAFADFWHASANAAKSNETGRAPPFKGPQGPLCTLQQRSGKGLHTLVATPARKVQRLAELLSRSEPLQTVLCSSGAVSLPSLPRSDAHKTLTMTSLQVSPLPPLLAGLSSRECTCEREREGAEWSHQSTA